MNNRYHDVKIEPCYYVDVLTGIKTFELRKNDRDYRVGDYVHLREYDAEGYTGRSYMIKITYVLKDCRKFGLVDGYCIFGWRPDEL